MSVSASLVWAIACVLNLDTCCDCSWLCSVFVSQRYLNLTGLLLCGLEKFHAPASSARETPQLNIVLFYVALSLMLHMFQIKTKCARPVRPAHKRKATTAVTCCGAVAKVSGRPPDGSGHDRLVGWLVSSWSWHPSLHRHVAVGVVHERRRVQGGGHVLVAEL